jgi:hypothetical protein
VSPEISERSFEEAIECALLQRTTTARSACCRATWWTSCSPRPRIRLDLLRLHAGAGTVEGLTTHLGLAAEASEEVERLIAAHAEVERVLKFPRLAASTPP